MASVLHHVVVISRGYEGPILHATALYDGTAPTLTEPAFLALESERSGTYRKQSPTFPSDLTRALNFLLRIKRLGDDRHVKLVVVLIPDEVQVNRVLQSKVLQIKALSASSEDFDFALPNRQLAAKLFPRRGGLPLDQGLDLGQAPSSPTGDSRAL